MRVIGTAGDVERQTAIAQVGENGMGFGHDPVAGLGFAHFERPPALANSAHEPLDVIAKIDPWVNRRAAATAHISREDLHLPDGRRAVLGHHEPVEVDPERGFGFADEAHLAQAFDHHANHHPRPPFADERERAVEVE